MRIVHLRHFIAAVDAGSLRAGARRAGVSRPAMTKSLHELERNLGVRLLARGTRELELTREGRAFLARARSIDAELRHAHDEVAALSGGVAGASVDVGIGPALCPAVPHALARFRARFPATHVRIVEGVRSALLGWLREETLDFIVVQDPGGAPREPGLDLRPLLRPELVVAGRRGHPLARARSLRELTGAAWLRFNPPGYGGFLDAAFRSAGLAPPRARVLCESFATALLLVSQSDLLGLFFEPFFAEPLAARLLHRFRIAERIGAPSVVMLTRARARLSPPAAAMAKAMAGSVRAMARTPGGKRKAT